MLNTLWTRAFWVVVPGLVMTGCGPNPLVGHWIAGTTDLATTMALNADGSASFTIVGSAACRGTLDLQGLTWSSSTSTITFGGTVACSGSVMCTFASGPTSLDCMTVGSGPQNGTCGFALAGNSLTVSACAGSMGGVTTYTRN